MKSIIDYTNLLKSFFAQKQALSDEVATRSYLGAENLLQIKARESNSGRGTWTGNSFVGQNAPNLTFTVNDDETITVNGYTDSSDEFIVLNLYVENGVQKNTDYAIGKSCILTGCPSGGSASSYFMRFFRYDGSNSAVDVGNGVNLTPTAVNSGWKNITVNVAANTTVNNITFKPMIRLASDLDPTYQPFAKPNTELTKDDIGLTANAFANGAVNLLPNKMKSQTGNSLTIIVDNDGVVRTSGTSTGSSWLRIMQNEYLELPAGTYRLSGCPSGGSTSTDQGNYMCYASRFDSSNTWIDDYFDIGNGVDIPITTGQKLQVVIRIITGTNMNGKVFKPMITVADMPNSDYNHYVPYAMTNRELTDVANEFISNKALSDTTSFVPLQGTNYGDGCRYIKIGCFVFLIISVQFDAAPSGKNIFTLPTGYRPLTLMEISVSGGGSYNSKAQCVIYTDGSIIVSSADKYVTGSGIFIV